MRILFVDDEPENVAYVRSLIDQILPWASVEHASTLMEAVEALHRPGEPPALVVTDVFIPMAEDEREVLRLRRSMQGIEHLGGLALLDEIDRIEPRPAVLVHTACTEYALFEILREHGHERVPKPAPVEVMLRAVMEALQLPVPR